MTRTRRRWWRWLLAGAALLVLAAMIAAAVFVVPPYLRYQRLADQFDLHELGRMPAISEVFDRRGHRYSRLAGEARYVIPFDQIPPDFINALLAREDTRFFDHAGVDYRGILRAAARNLQEGEIREGASTLTQQLARNSFDLPADRWERKFVEALLARRIEDHLNKREILEAYVNRIYYGRGMYGLETAARACFGKPARELDLSECATLVGLIRSPNKFSPLEDTALAISQRNEVLARMEELRLITGAEAANARQLELPATKRLPAAIQQDYAMDAVRRDLEVILTPDQIDQGGLRIHTSIDPRLQQIAQTLVAEHLAGIESADTWPHPRFDAETEETDSTDALQAALIAIDNETGGIAAIVGGRDFVQSPFNRALLARRQVGSTFKPFVYAAAFGAGLLPGTWLDDGPLAAAELPAENQKWNPGNSDGANLGLIPASEGLIRSRNTMSIRAGQIADAAAVAALAARAGLGEIPTNPAVFLGAFESTLKDLTAAYTTFPNAGVRRQPHIVTHIFDRSGQTLYRATRGEIRVISPAVASLTNDLLKDIVKLGTAAGAKSYGLTVPAAGKTGTTDAYKDAWFVGYTSSLTCGVWVGFDDPRTITDRGYGSRLALPVWTKFIEAASSRDYAADALTTSVPQSELTLCHVTGRLATTTCASLGTAYQTRLPTALTPQSHCSHAAPDPATAPPLPTRFAESTLTPVPEPSTQAPPIQAPSSDTPPPGAVRTQNGFLFY